MMRLCMKPGRSDDKLLTESLPAERKENTVVQSKPACSGAVPCPGGPWGSRGAGSGSGVCGWEAQGDTGASPGLCPLRGSSGAACPRGAGCPPQEPARSSAARLQPRFGIGRAGSASMRPAGCKSVRSSQRRLPARALRPEPGTCRVTPAGATAAVPVPLSVFPKGLVVLGSAGAAKGCLQHKDQRGGEMEQVVGMELGELVHPWHLTLFQLLDAKIIWKLVLQVTGEPRITAE